MPSLSHLFADFLGSDECLDFGFDNGSVCRWLNGMTRVSPLISKYYLNPERLPSLADNMKQISDLQDFIKGQPTDITEFDETLVKRLIAKITVFEDRFTVDFKSGLAIDIEA